MRLESQNKNGDIRSNDQNSTSIRSDGLSQVSGGVRVNSFRNGQLVRDQLQRQHGDERRQYPLQEKLKAIVEGSSGWAVACVQTSRSKPLRFPRTLL